MDQHEYPLTGSFATEFAFSRSGLLLVSTGERTMTDALCRGCGKTIHDCDLIGIKIRAGKAEVWHKSDNFRQKQNCEPR